MKTKVLCIALLPAFMLGASIDDIVKNSFEKNRQLKSIEQSIKIANQNIKLSSKYQNPVLSIGANDIYFDEPFTRDKEAMQASFIGISQTIESSSKLKFKEDIEQNNESIQKLILEDKKLNLKSQIYKKSLNILILEERIDFFEEYEKNLLKLIDLSSAYFEVGNSNQNEILDLQIKLQEIKLNIKKLINQKENLYVDLKSISYLDIKSIESDILNTLSNDIKALKNFDINTHPKILILNEQINKEKNKEKLENEKKFSDFKVSAAYFSRDNKFKDYANIAVSIPLGINNRENIEIVKAKLNASKINDEKEDLINTLNAQIQNLRNDIDLAISSIELIEKQIIPTKIKIQENIENYASLKGENFKKVVLNMNELINYKIKLNDYKKLYVDSYSNLLYFNQGTTNVKN